MLPPPPPPPPPLPLRSVVVSHFRGFSAGTRRSRRLCWGGKPRQQPATMIEVVLNDRLGKKASAKWDGQHPQYAAAFAAADPAAPGAWVMGSASGRFCKKIAAEGLAKDNHCALTAARWCLPACLPADPRQVQRGRHSGGPQEDGRSTDRQARQASKGSTMGAALPVLLSCGPGHMGCMLQLVVMSLTCPLPAGTRPEKIRIQKWYTGGRAARAGVARRPWHRG
jgi:hypothetical protein